SQIAQSLTNWVERMRRTYLVLLIGHKTTVKNSLTLCLTGRVYACSAVSLLLNLYLTLTAKMEDSIAKLKQFSKLDFQTKRKVINNGRPMPELKGTLQTKLKGMPLTPTYITLHSYIS